MKGIHLVLAWLAVTNALTIKIPDFDIGIDLGHYGKPTKTSTTNSKKSTSSSRPATIPSTGSFTVSTLKSATSLPSSAKASGSSKQASSGSVSASRSTVSGTSLFSSSLSGCTVTVYSTITTTSIPFVTQTTYVGTINYINGDDLVPQPTPGTVQTITNDYTTNIDTTLTVTATSIPPQYLGYTTTVTAYPPSGFIPAQDSLPSAGYDGLYAGGPLQRRAKKRQAGSCSTTTSTVTSLVVAKTRVSFVTDSSSINAVAFPQEDYTLYNEPLPSVTVINGVVTTLGGPYTLTKVVGTPQTNYIATTTTTTTITKATATQTNYAACATNNFVDYIQQANGTKSPINFVTQNRQTDFSFLIADTDLAITTAYACCQFAIENAGSAWALISSNFCAVSYPSGSGNPGQQGACYGQSDSREQFDVSYANKTQIVAGNGYCGQITSSYYGTNPSGQT